MPVKADLKEINELNWERFKATLHEEIALLRAEMREGNSSVRADLHAEMSTVRGDLRSDMKAMQANIMKWMFIYWSGTPAVIIGMN
ncbi:MAG TPA: hypothetical protein VM099_13710 [Gemmatimonadaceae bacterium]|nr:hypothetical protein [Gemmatimonadaceae bacterium]